MSPARDLFVVTSSWSVWDRPAPKQHPAQPFVVDLQRLRRGAHVATVLDYRSQPLGHGAQLGAIARPRIGPHRRDPLRRQVDRAQRLGSLRPHLVEEPGDIAQPLVERHDLEGAEELRRVPSTADAWSEDRADTIGAMPYARSNTSPMNASIRAPGRTASSGANTVPPAALATSGSSDSRERVGSSTVPNGRAHRRAYIEENVQHTPPHAGTAAQARELLRWLALTRRSIVGMTRPLGRPDDALGPRQPRGVRLEVASDAGANEAGDLVSPSEIYRRQTTEAPPDPRLWNPAIDPRLAQAIRRALACAPAERWPNAIELIRAVAETVEPDGSSPGGATILETWAPAVWDPADALWGLRTVTPPVPAAGETGWTPPPTAVSISSELAGAPAARDVTTVPLRPPPARPSAGLPMQGTAKSVPPSGTTTCRPAVGPVAASRQCWPAALPWRFSWSRSRSAPAAGPPRRAANHRPGPARHRSTPRRAPRGRRRPRAARPRRSPS